MKKAQQQSREWFRFENAHKDEENATDELTKVYIYGEIGDSWWGDSTSANEFVKLLSGVKSKKIELHLNSPGGSIFDGIAIYNSLKDHSAEVHVVIDALAASAASFIAQAGDTVTMTKAATMMIHDGSTGAYGDAAYLRETADILDKLSNTVAGIYADRAGEDVTFWRNLMIQEVWYNAEEAVAAGLADDVGSDTTETDLEDAKNRWDLSMFNYEGRNAAPDPMELRRRIANTLKEAPVAEETPSTETPDPETGAPATGNPVSPETNPDTPTTAPDEEETTSEPGAVPNPPVPEQAQPAENSATGPGGQVAFVPVNEANKPVVFMVNGTQTSDPMAVQNHLNMLENFRNETLTQARRDFVEGLAADKKILQSSVEKLTAYALSLPTDEAFSAWKATYDDAPTLSMLENHGGSERTPGRPTEAGTNADNEVSVYMETVKQHKLGGMKDDKIMATPSYKKLIALDPTFKLENL